MGIKTLTISVLANLTFATSALAEHHEGHMGMDNMGGDKPLAITGDFASSLSMYGQEFQRDGNNAF